MYGHPPGSPGFSPYGGNLPSEVIHTKGRGNVGCMIGVILVVVFGGVGLNLFLATTVNPAVTGVFVPVLIAITFGIVFVGNIFRKYSEQKLMAHGLRGQAQVLDASPTGVRINNRPVLKFLMVVQLPGKPPYQAIHKDIVSKMSVMRMAPGAELPVFVDPNDRRRMAVDWSGAMGMVKHHRPPSAARAFAGVLVTLAIMAGIGVGVMMMTADLSEDGIFEMFTGMDRSDDEDDEDEEDDWDGEDTFECQRKAELVDVEVDSDAEPAIDLGMSCKLLIEDSEIVADELIDLGYGDLVVKNSTLTTRQNEPFVITSNGDVEIIDSTIIVKPKDDDEDVVVFTVRGNGGFKIENSTIEIVAPSSKSTVIVGLGQGNGDIEISDASKIISKKGPKPKELILFRDKGNSDTSIEDSQVITGGWPTVIDAPRETGVVSDVALKGTRFVNPDGSAYDAK